MTQPSPFEDLPPATPEAAAGHPAGRSRRGFAIAIGFLLGSAFLVSVGLAFVAGVGAERLGVFAAPLAPAPSASAIAGSSGDELALVEKAWDLLHTEYVGRDELDSQAMAWAAIGAMTEAVGDTGHTMFLTPAEFADAQSSLSGSYAGIGAELDVKEEMPVIVGVFRGTPADRAGLVPGDVIVTVDGVATEGKALESIISKIRGPEGTPVTLGIRSAGSNGVRPVRIVRATVEIPTVEAALIPGTTIGMVRVEQFSDGAGATLRRELETLLKRDPSALILDLRGNPGGYVTEAVAVASEFLASGVVYEERAADGSTKSTDVTPGGIATDLPLVVLVDNGTASAGEIVTGALQDPKRATVVGARTFGTGTVLGTFELPDGSALRIGTVEWLTPKGRVIWHEGLAPDVTVELPEGVRPLVPSDLETMTADQVRASRDAQLLRAIELLTAPR